VGTSRGLYQSDGIGLPSTKLRSEPLDFLADSGGLTAPEEFAIGRAQNEFGGVECQGKRGRPVGQPKGIFSCLQVLGLSPYGFELELIGSATAESGVIICTYRRT
jgi:hypothetical protein